MPENTLLAFADHGEVAGLLTPGGGDAEQIMGAFARAGVDVDALATRLQAEGADAFTRSWEQLLRCIDGRVQQLAVAR